MTTIASGVWSAVTFARVSHAVDETVRGRQLTIDLTAQLAATLEREDDALLLAVSGDPRAAKDELARQRESFDGTYARLVAASMDLDPQGTMQELDRRVREYRRLGDELVAAKAPAGDRYRATVNPALRAAVEACGQLRELSFRSMELAGIRARDEARRAVGLVAFVSIVSLALSSLVALYLARTIVRPVRALTESVDALRVGKFEQRVQVGGPAELQTLADGFNRMAEALAELRRWNLDEVLRAKDTLEATLAALPDAVFVVEADGSIGATNPMARRLELRPTRASDLGLPRDAQAALEAALAGRPVPALVPDLARTVTAVVDARPRRLLPIVAPVLTSDRPRAVVVLHDVTEFARLDELRSELVGVASHELRTPLTTLRMNLMLLDERASQLDPRLREILDTARLGCQQLSDTIDELLDLTRIEAGQLRLSLDRIDLRVVVRRVVDALRPQFEDAGIAVRVEGVDAPIVVRGDPVRLGLVLSNVLSNALKYTPPRGAVEVACSTSGSDARLAITDTGRGVPEGLRERVFEKFFRVEHHDPGHGQSQGAGIGLYVSRQIVEAHGGRIACEPGPEGRGARVMITLPVETEAAPTPESPQRAGAAAR